MRIEVIYLLSSFILTAILGKIFIPILKKLIILSIVVFTGISLIFFKDKETVMSLIGISLATIGFGVVGFLDDFKKVVLKNTEGLNPKLKMLGLLIISSLYTLFLVKYLNISTDIYIPFIKVNLLLPLWIYIPFTIFVMLSTTNAVNLTDGVDGLAGSVSAIMITAISVMAIKLGVPEVSIFGAIVVGSTIGFLIYNFHKAKVIMGDTGSLLLGGALSSMAIYLKLPLIILVVAIIPILETLSVIMQVLYFRKTGKRLFRMSPLHHHFELTGWRENKVVGIFSLVTLIGSVIGILAI